MDHTKYRTIRRHDISHMEPLLTDVLIQGKLAVEFPSLDTLRARRETDMERLDPGIRRLVNPHIYHVSLTPELWNLKQRLIEEATQENATRE